MEKLICSTIQKVLAGINLNNIRCRNTDAGWLIEVVHSGFKQQTNVDNLTEALNKLMDQSNRSLNIWKLFLYPDESERFTVSGTLHTVEPRWENGVETVILSANDCYIYIPEFEAEAMTLSNYKGLEIEAIESISERTGDPIMRFHEKAPYCWLEVLGGQYGIKEARRQEVKRERLTIVLANSQ